MRSGGACAPSKPLILHPCRDRYSLELPPGLKYCPGYWRLLVAIGAMQSLVLLPPRTVQSPGYWRLLLVANGAMQSLVLLSHRTVQSPSNWRLVSGYRCDAISSVTASSHRAVSRLLASVVVRCSLWRYCPMPPCSLLGTPEHLMLVPTGTLQSPVLLPCTSEICWSVGIAALRRVPYRERPYVPLKTETHMEALSPVRAPNSSRLDG